MEASLSNPRHFPVRLPGDPEVLTDLRDKGYTIVKVLTEEKNDEIRAMFWDWLEGTYEGVDRNDSKTWVDDSGSWPGNSHGILMSESVGHAPFMWEARQQQDVIRTFANIWDAADDEMVTSFDGACMIRPSETNPITKPNKWEHFDQNYYLHEGLENIQGLLNLEDSQEKDGGLVVYPHSNKQFVDFFKRKPNFSGRGNFVRIPQKDEILKQQKGLPDSGRTKVVAPKGTLLLWDSRTAHCNEAPHADRGCNEYHKFRSCAYICMKPRSFSKGGELKKRYEWFKEGVSTTHYPIHCVPNHGTSSENYNAVPMNNVIKNLIGYEKIEVPDVK